MTTHFKPPKIKRSFEEISSEIKKLIFQGVFKPGDRLPSQIEIARQFNVGRQMIRESMRILEQSGFITIQQGVKGGPFTVDTMLNRLSTLFIDIFYFKKVSPHELAEARFDIEKAMLRRVIEALVAVLSEFHSGMEKVKLEISRRITKYHEDILLTIMKRNYTKSVDLLDKLLKEVGALLTKA